MVCDCCRRDEAADKAVTFSCDSWCDECSSGCDPYGRKGRACPARLAELRRTMGVVAQRVAVRGGRVVVASAALR